MSEIITVTMDEFEAEVRHLMEEDSLTFVRAVWAVMDDLTDATFRSRQRRSSGRRSNDISARSRVWSAGRFSRVPGRG